jgi:DNA-binding transcriptional MocR family regulator
MNKKQTVRVETLSALVSFLIKKREGFTHSELAERAQCSIKTVIRYLTALHAEGLIYVKGIRRDGTKGPAPVVWCWQFFGPFHQPDEPDALRVFQEQKQAMDAHVRKYLDRYKQERQERKHAHGQ